ncbi:hypothetical protein [Streptomyces sp. NPDC018352]
MNARAHPDVDSEGAAEVKATARGIHRINARDPSSAGSGNVCPVVM